MIGATAVRMELLINFLLFLSSCYAAKEGVKGKDLQSEIEEYLRTLARPQPVYQGSAGQPVYEASGPQPDSVYPAVAQPGVGNVHPFLSLKSQSSRYMPGGLPAANGYLPSDDERIPQQPWPGLLPGGYRSGAATAFASSSAHVQKPNGGAAASGIDADSIAYSSVRDVDAEENLGLGPVVNREFTEMFSSDEQRKTSPEATQHTITVPEPMARKSNTMTTAQQNTVPVEAEKNFSDVYFVAIVAGCSAAGIFGIISAGLCFYRLQKNSKASADVDYPAYGVTGPSKESSSPNGDRKLAQSAQMYHYQHQKQQMIAVEKAGSAKHTSASDVESEEENEEGDYTVYECPGLASTGEMEVKNPLFNDDSTPMTPVLPAKPETSESK